MPGLAGPRLSGPGFRTRGPSTGSGAPALRNDRAKFKLRQYPVLSMPPLSLTSWRDASHGSGSRAGKAGPGGQCPRRNPQRPLQSRGDPSARPLAQLRNARVRHPRTGRLVQPPPPLRADRQHPSRPSRDRDRLLCPACDDPYRRVGLNQNPLRKTRLRKTRRGSDLLCDESCALVVRAKTLMRAVGKMRTKTAAGVYAKALLVRGSRIGAEALARSLASDLTALPALRASLWQDEAL